MESPAARLTKLDIIADPEGAKVCIEGIVPLPREYCQDAAIRKQRYQAALDRVRASLPELLPLLVLRHSGPQNESR